MRFAEMLRMIAVNVMQNKFKVLLTSLGIIVGAVTIVLVIAIGMGGEAEIANRFGDLSAATIYINPDYSKSNLFDRDLQKMEQLSIDSVEQIKQENPYLKSIMLAGYTLGNAVIGGEKVAVNLAGVTASYEEVSNLPTAYGVNLTESDVLDASMTTVIGHGLAVKYFGDPEYAVGESLHLNNKVFKIIGVLARKGDGIQGLSPDDTVFLPYTTAQSYAFEDYTISQAVALADDVKNVAPAMKWIRSTLDYIFDDNAYAVEDAGSRMEAATESARTMKTLLISVAAIVFVVSGIGIMNVLFVSVRERTREIGVLKALGCFERDILLQFLLESVFISLSGSIAGMLLSFMLLPLMRYTNIPVLSSVGGYLAALFFSLLTGTVFGYYPAYKASRLNPIDALNYE